VPAIPGSVDVRPRSIVLAVLTVTVTLLVLRVLADAGRVIGWTAMAAAAATTLTAAVRALSRHVPRGVALAVVALATLGTAGLVAYGIVGDVVAQTRNLQRDAPQLARRLERSGRFADAARQARLSERVADAVDKIPERLRGGTPAQAARSAATRGLAFLAIAVLTMFFVIHGGRITTAAAAQVRDPDRRATLERVGHAVETRAFGYARGTAAMALLAGCYAFVLARATSLPGPAPLAVWVALWDVVPLVGTIVGALPLVLLAAVIDPARGALLIVAFVAWQAVEYLVLQRRLERATVRVGPFLTIASGFAGVELYGIAGGLLAILAAAIAVVVVEEVARPAGRVPRAHADE
jgi:predicted PurR-regulated permease PerM